MTKKYPKLNGNFYQKFPLANERKEKKQRYGWKTCANVVVIYLSQPQCCVLFFVCIFAHQYVGVLWLHQYQRCVRSFASIRHSYALDFFTFAQHMLHGVWYALFMPIFLLRLLSLCRHQKNWMKIFDVPWQIVLAALACNCEWQNRCMCLCCACMGSLHILHVERQLRQKMENVYFHKRTRQRKSIHIHRTGARSTAIAATARTEHTGSAKKEGEKIIVPYTCRALFGCVLVCVRVFFSVETWKLKLMWDIFL